MVPVPYPSCEPRLQASNAGIVVKHRMARPAEVKVAIRDASEPLGIGGSAAAAALPPTGAIRWHDGMFMDG